MKANTDILILVLLIFGSALIGAGSTYHFNKTFHIAHETTYSLEEEISNFDSVIEKIREGEINESALIRIVEGHKETRVAIHNLKDSGQRLSKKIIVLLIIVAIGQMYLVFSYVKSKNEQ